MVATEPEEIEHPQIVNLSQVHMETFQSDLVRASQSIIGGLQAEEVEFQTSAAGSVSTHELQAKDSIIGTLVCNQAAIVDSFVSGIRAETIDLNGIAGAVVANNVKSDEVRALTVIAADIHATNINIGILLSREVHGNVFTTMDGQTALLVGLAGGVSAGLIMLTGRLLLRRKK